LQRQIDAVAARDHAYGRSLCTSIRDVGTDNTIAALRDAGPDRSLAGGALDRQKNPPTMTEGGQTAFWAGGPAVGAGRRDVKANRRHNSAS